MASLKGEKNFFSEEERNFIEFLIDNKRICILKQAEEKNVGKTYESKEGEKVMEQLKSAEFVKGRHVKNIISEATKLSIRNYID